MTNAEQLETISIQDKFIREVRVTYHGSQAARFSINGPTEAADFVRSVLPDNSREHCVALYLDASHQVASYSIVTTGTANSAQLHAREVFQRAVVTGAIQEANQGRQPRTNQTRFQQSGWPGGSEFLGACPAPLGMAAILRRSERLVGQFDLVQHLGRMIEIGELLAAAGAYAQRAIHQPVPAMVAEHYQSLRSTPRPFSSP